MKRALVFVFSILTVVALSAQTYPEPEFSNEVYLLKKDNPYTLVRLEKGSSKMESKVKAAGFGGSEAGYTIDGDKSSVRLNGGGSLSFVISTGASSHSSAKSDSAMKANGVDPSMMSGMGEMFDPVRTVTLYKMETGKNERKILLQKTPGANPFGSHKVQSSDKYTFSAKKVRDGYWELVIDKTLPKGEYGFTMMDLMSGGAGAMGTLVFSFGID